ncbi:helix-turn-helix transcriptional regulator [Streptomyces sp. enrichment culture]|uniref:helix-turn-helix transcriptional regulator n=1 Tax=Streptomyces sp. enrichment culture TaxID=1795815 RepID=UPI003F56E0FF
MAYTCAILGGVEITSLSPVFVGRTAELTALTDALTRAAQGEPRALLVAGEAGVGKTRLVEEFLGEARRRGAAVAVGGCVEIGADGLPFAPFATALRALRRALPDAFAAAAEGQEGELARLLPELGDPHGHHEPHADDGTARLFELAVRLLERVAADHTVVLVLEDLHWADTSTRHLLAYLLRTLAGGRLVVLATYRSDDIHRRHALRPLLAEIDRLRTVRRVELPRFTRAEVHRQLTGILAAEPDPALVDEIFRRSDGNAFFVEELVVSHEQGCSPGGLSDSLRDLLLVRVERLPDDAQNVVRTVAEGGSTVEYALLAAVAGLPEDDLIAALRAAVGANILLAVPDGDGYRFRHSLVREAVSDDLLPGERSRINRRYAQALEADPSLVRADERTTRLAGYWYHAHDAAKALPVVLRAAAEARRRHAHAERLRLLERAMELWDDVPRDVRDTVRPIDHAEAYPACGCDPDTTPLRYLDLLAEAAVAARQCGDRERALTIVKRALRLLADGDDPLRAAWFWTERSRLVTNLGRGDGWAELATAQELVRGLPPSAVHAQVLAVAAGWGMLHAPGPDSLTAAERAVEYARLVGVEPVELNARLTLGSLMVDAGDVEGGLAEMRAVRERTVKLRLIGEAGRAHTNLSSTLESVGRSREAVEVAEAGIAYTREHGLLDNEAWVLGNLAEAQLSLGLWEEAERGAQRLLRLAAASSKPRGFALLRLAQLHILRGETDAAAAHTARARELLGAHAPMPQFTLPLTRLELTVAAARGRTGEVRELLAGAVADGFPAGTHRYAWPLLLAAATAEADARPADPRGVVGDAEAERAVRTVRDGARTLAAPVPLWEAYAEFVAAELARAEGRDDPDRWAALVAALERLQRPYELARARYRLADALLAGGRDRDEAAEALREARAVAVRLGARALREDAELLAARARLSLDPGEPAAPPAPGPAFGLTGRERDVLRLVARGRTNRAIAEELFISPKTASVHVSRILAKLGASSRTEAAALAHRLRLLDAGQEAR